MRMFLEGMPAFINVSALSRLTVLRNSSSRVCKMRVDAHVHIWTQRFATHPSHPLPSIDGSAEHLIALMDSAAIDKAIVVQPINYMFDHSYVKHAMTKYSSRLYGVGLADTTGSAENACEMVSKLVSDGFRGIRINPSFSNGFQNEVVKEVCMLAGRLDIPVCFFAKEEHLDDIQWLIENCPTTKVVIDHFGFADNEKAQDAVIQVVKSSSQVYIKASAWFRVSKTSYPHDDLTPFLQRLLDTIPASRLLFGSDFPYVSEQYTYDSACNVISEKASLEAISQIGGKSAEALYKL